MRSRDRFTHVMPAPPDNLQVSGKSAPSDCDREGPVTVIRKSRLSFRLTRLRAPTLTLVPTIPTSRSSAIKSPSSARSQPPSSSASTSRHPIRRCGFRRNSSPWAGSSGSRCWRERQVGINRRRELLPSEIASTGARRPRLRSSRPRAGRVASISSTAPAASLQLRMTRL
jgi:hypothetical protein